MCGARARVEVWIFAQSQLLFDPSVWSVMTKHEDRIKRGAGIGRRCLALFEERRVGGRETAGRAFSRYPRFAQRAFLRLLPLRTAMTIIVIRFVVGMIPSPPLPSSSSYSSYSSSLNSVSSCFSPWGRVEESAAWSAWRAPVSCRALFSGLFPCSHDPFFGCGGGRMDA